MKLTLLLTIFVCSILSSNAQHLDVSIIQQGYGYNDSSYYDISKINDSCFWVVGKYGILTELKNNGTFQKINFPSMGTDLLSVDRFDDNNYIITADKGYIYTYNYKTTNWNVQQIKGYEHSAFYSICIIDSLNAFVCGGNSKIIRSQISMPKGFILKTKDGGKSWTESYSNKFNMIWDVYYDKNQKEIYASLYKPNKTTIVATSLNEERWLKKSDKVHGLMHNISQNQNQEIVGVGGKNFQTKKAGLYSDKAANSFQKFSASGLLWDFWQNKDFSLIAGSKGCMLYKYNNTNWQTLQTSINPNYNLYEVKSIDQSSVYVVGSGKTILRVDYRQ